MSSRVLVFLQFAIVALVLIPKATRHACSFCWLFILVSISVALWTFRHNRLGNFNIVPEIREHARLVTTGPYRYIRHPMYSSLFFGMTGLVCYLSHWLNWLLLGTLVIVLWLKASREEKLWCDHHPDYVCYREGTRYFIPFLL